MTNQRHLTILAIDDEEDILYTLTAIGRTMGWHVRTEADGTRAVERFRELRPDLVLVDYHMPKQDGLTTVRAIRRLDRAVPVIVLTVDERQDVADRFLEAGASDFANKPVKVADLAARIHVHMRLLDRMREAGETACEKGINSATLDLVREFCRRAGGPFLIEEAAENSGLAYQTAFRYLQHLQQRRELTSTSDYGKVGRPRKRYQYIGS